MVRLADILDFLKVKLTFTNLGETVTGVNSLYRAIHSEVSFYIGDPPCPDSKAIYVIRKPDVPDPKLAFVKVAWKFFPPAIHYGIETGETITWADHSNVVLGDEIFIGKGTVLGGDGFGFVRDTDGSLIKFPHYGKVIIGDNVEIQANCAIDRGSLEDTVIGDGTKIDNLVHIAHNVKVGKRCLITDGVKINGSAVIGDYCYLGSGCIIRDGITVGRNVLVGMGAVVTKDVPDDVVVAGNPARILRRNGPCPWK